MSYIFRQLNDQLSGKELFIRFTARAFRKLMSVYVYSYFPFGFERRIWDLIVSVPDNCLSLYSESDDSGDALAERYSSFKTKAYCHFCVIVQASLI